MPERYVRMEDQDKTKEQLMCELVKMRRRVAEGVIRFAIGKCAGRAA